MIPAPAVQRGRVSEVKMTDLGGFVVTVDLGYSLVVDGAFSSVFLGELNARRAMGSVESLVGSMVEVTFNAGRQPAIAYTVGT